MMQRAFYAVRQLYARIFMDTSLTRVTAEEAIAIIRQHDLSVKITIGKSDCDFTSYFDWNENRIHISPEDLYEEVILHEVGHAVCGREVGSYNSNWRHINYYQPEDFLNAEIEAWRFAEKYSTNPWTDSHRAHVRMCLDGYKAIDPKRYSEM